MLACFYDAPHEWSQAQQEAFSTFGRQAGFALVGARLFDEQIERKVEVEVLLHTNQRFRRTLTPEAMYPILVEQAMELVGADYGCLALLDRDHQLFTRIYARGTPAGVPRSTFPVAGSRSGQILQTGRPYVCTESPDEPLHEVDPAHDGLGPLMIVPVKSEDAALGTITVARRRRPEHRPFSGAQLHLLEGIADIAGAAIRQARLHQALQRMYGQMVVALEGAIEPRGAEPEAHTARKAALAEAIARALGCHEEDAEDVRWGARLHDIGIIGVPDLILAKPESLTEQEWEAVRQHPIIGEEMLHTVERMQRVATFVRHHQERWDGRGYPDRLQGTAIPAGARILAVVEAYGAMTRTRPHQPARTHEEAVAEIRRCAGTQFDPRVVEAFCKVAS